MAAGSPRVLVACRRPHRSIPVPSCRCAALRIASCIGRACAARCGPKCATAASGFSASPAASSISTAGPRLPQRQARGELQKAAQTYAHALGVKVKRLSIRDQSSRWGSCTSAGSLSFSWRLILAPPYVLDYLAPMRWRISSK